MKNQNANDRLGLAKLTVMVERHLQSEIRLLEQLDELSQTMRIVLEESGSRGLSPQQQDQLDLLTCNLSKTSAGLKVKRQAVLSAINSGRASEQPPLSIRQFVQMLNTSDAERLESLRISILDRLTESHATLIGNQAVMFYTYDFYRKMVAGLLSNDMDENQYSMTGQSAAVKPGNLIRKAC